MSDECNQEETQARLEVCKQCKHFVITEIGTDCLACNCSIGLMTTTTMFNCPEGNW